MEKPIKLFNYEGEFSYSGCNNTVTKKQLISYLHYTGLKFNPNMKKEELCAIINQDLEIPYDKKKQINVPSQKPLLNKNKQILKIPDIFKPTTQLIETRQDIDKSRQKLTQQYKQFLSQSQGSEKIPKDLRSLSQQFSKQKSRIQSIQQTLKNLSNVADNIEQNQCRLYDIDHDFFNGDESIKRRCKTIKNKQTHLE
jgi:vacuolar-type H+-ATPase subunit I/STV1